MNNNAESKSALSNCYYLLGQGNEQLAVYYGYTNTRGCHPMHDDEFSCCESWAETAYYYLGEYNIYAPGGVPITFKVNEDGTSFKTNYKIQDYLGNVRAVINQDKQITGMYDYMPFGEQVPVSLSGTKDRLSFIGKENDVESGLGDFGVRKYDDAAGRFLSIDPMWEKYLAWSPYHYCGNNPINGSDPSGLADFFSPTTGDFLYHKDDGTNKQFLQYKTPEIKVSFITIPSIIFNQEINMNDDVGIVARTVYAEMRGKSDDSKLVVAESIRNRKQLPDGAYEKANGSILGIVNKFYDATKKGNDNYDEYSNPFESANRDSKSTNAWRSSISASIKALLLDSDVGNGVIFYNSSDANQWDGKLPKITPDRPLNGIKGLWKLK